MSLQMLAYCGIDCAVCPAYIATQANNIEKLTSLAGEWFEGASDYTIVLCDGCAGQGRIMKWCGECTTRACATQRQVENCAYCEAYGCDKLRKVFEMSADAKTNLDRIRTAL